MRPHKSTILIALVALLLTAFVAVMAQQPSGQSTDQKKAAAESCCKDGSCPMMKKEGATANADAKHDCCGDSCDMKKEGTTANADAKPASADAATAGADMKHDCCGDSCDMANHAKHDAKHDKKMHAADGSCCKAKSKDAKQKDAKSN